MNPWFYLVAAALLIFSHQWLLPKTFSHYGKTYFGLSIEKAQITSLQRFAAYFMALGFSLPIFINWFHPQNPMTILMAIIGSGIVLLDIRFQVIPDRFHIFAISSVLLLSASNQTISYQVLLYRSLAAIITVLVLATSNAIFLKVRGRMGVGWGDIKMMAWMTLLMGHYSWAAFVVATLLSLIVVLAARVLNKKDFADYFAFGPYLVITVIGYQWLQY